MSAAAAFPYVDTAIGGLDRRNRPMPLADFRPGPDLADCFRTFCRFGDDFPAFVAGNTENTGKPSVAGYPGPALATFFPADFDHDDPAVALADAAVFLRRLEAMDVPTSAVRLYFSGHKGFHAEVPAALFGGFPPARNVARRLKAVAAYLLDGLSTADLVIYEKLRLWRAEGTRHGATGLYKVRLSPVDVLAGDLDAIRAIATAPRDWAETPDDEWEAVPALVEAWEATATERPEERELAGPSATTAATALTASQIEAMVAVVAPHWRLGQKHELSRCVAGWWAKQGVPREQADAMAKRLSARDERPWDRMNAVRDSYAKHAAGISVEGWTGMRRMLPPDALAALDALLGPRTRSQNAQRTHNSADRGDSVYRVNSEHPSEWSEPLPLETYDRPEFPTSCLPDALRWYVEALATATQTPVGLVALMALAVIAGAAAKRVAVYVRDGWIEPVNVYALAVLGSGNRKSAVVAEVVAPLEAAERDAAKEKAREAKIRESEYKILEGRLAKAQREAAGADDAERPALVAAANTLAEELAAFRIPEVPRYLADDCSPEKLTILLARQDGRIAIVSPEGGVFDLMGGRYTQNGAPNFEVYLKGYSGDTIRVDRVGRPPEFVREPAVTLGLAVQPEVLNGLTAKPGFRGRGLLARFWYAVLNSMVGRRQVAAPPLADDLRAEYNDLIAGVLAIPPHTNEDGSWKPRRLHLHEDAAAVFLAFEEGLEPRLGPDGDLSHVADWGGKLAGAVARLTGLLHLVKYADDAEPWARGIDSGTVGAAVRIAEEFLIPHALAAFGEMGADQAVEGARHVLRWLERTEGKREDGGAEVISRRDVHQHLRRRFPKPDDLDGPLRLLEQLGYLREVGDDDRGVGRRTILRFAVNPSWRSQNLRRTQNSPEDGDSVFRVNSVYGEDAA